MKIEINGELWLDKLRLSDAEIMTKELQDEEIYRNTLALPKPYTLDDAKEWIVKNLEQSRGDNYPLNFAIRLKNRWIGSIGSKPFTHDITRQHETEIGYLIARDFRGKGYGSLAVKAFSEYLFTTFPLQRLTAYVFPGNSASMKLLEKAGYAMEGTARKFYRKDDQYLDCRVFSLIKA